MRASTRRFGELEVPDEQVVEFPEGILGFPALRRCCLLPCGDGLPLRWLVCLDEEALAFLTLEPHTVFPDYEIELPAADQEALELVQAEEALPLVLVTVCEDGQAVTANLVAPIIVNLRTRRARQVVLEDERYCTRHLVGIWRKDAGDAGADTTRGRASADRG